MKKHEVIKKLKALSVEDITALIKGYTLYDNNVFDGYKNFICNGVIISSNNAILYDNDMINVTTIKYRRCYTKNEIIELMTNELNFLFISELLRG